MACIYYLVRCHILLLNLAKIIVIIWISLPRVDSLYVLSSICRNTTFWPCEKTYSVEGIEMISKVMLQLNLCEKPILTSIRICSRYLKLYRKHDSDSANVKNLFFQRTLLCRGPSFDHHLTIISYVDNVNATLFFISIQKK